MNNKIIDVAKKIIAKPDAITDVYKNSDDEIFFTYLGKYIWSVNKSYNLFYYSESQSSKIMATFSPYDFEGVNLVAFIGDDLGTEAQHTFKALYELLYAKIYNMDVVFDDILKD